MRFDFEVHPTSENWAILVNKKDWNGSLKDQSNNQTALKQCEVHSSMSGVLTYGSFENNKIFHCLQGLIEEEISPDNCRLRFSYENCTAHMECLCRNKNDSVSGSAVNSLPEWLILVSVLLLLACLVLVVWVLHFCCTKRDKLTLKLGQYFRREPQGATNEQDDTHRRNSSEMQCDLKDAENGQCNPEECHSLLPEGISESSSDSAVSAVLELPLPNRIPGTPLPTLVTQEQTQRCSRLNDPGSALGSYSELRTPERTINRSLAERVPSSPPVTQAPLMCPSSC